MRNTMFRFLALVVGVLLVGGAAPVQGQGTFAHGAVVALQGTPHLWFADEHGVLHWGGDTRALSGKHVNWNDRRDVSLAELQTYPIGDPWLSAGLLKDGDPIYQVKWESDWPQPKLLHIQSIKDVELFGINGSNYGRYVMEQTAWEQRYGIPSSGLERHSLASAVSVPASAPQPVAIPNPTPIVVANTIIKAGSLQLLQAAFTQRGTSCLPSVAWHKTGLPRAYQDQFTRINLHIVCSEGQIV